MFVELSPTDGRFKSMLDLAPSEEPPAQTIMPAHNMDNLHPNQNTSSTVDSEVRICINDVTVDSSEDFTAGDGNNTELSIQELKKQQKRRSSWCPEENKKKEGRKEKQRTLAVTGRR